MMDLATPPLTPPLTNPVTTADPAASTEPAASTAAQPATDVQASIRTSLQAYFDDLGGEAPSNVYDMVLRLVERPLLEEIMAQADQNQSRAAQWLGLNRNTLRKKLLEHELL